MTSFHDSESPAGREIILHHPVSTRQVATALKKKPYVIIHDLVALNLLTGPDSELSDEIVQAVGAKHQVTFRFI